MLTETTILGIRLAILLGLRDTDRPTPPRHVAGALGASPTYLMKTSGALVKAGVLRAHRGAQGGVCLARPAADITLLDIVEACQGRLLNDYRIPGADPTQTCAFHQAMVEIHQSLTRILSRWTLADLIASPCPARELLGAIHCRIAFERDA